MCTVTGRGVGVLVGVPGRDGVFLGVAVRRVLVPGGGEVGLSETWAGTAFNLFSIEGSATAREPGLGSHSS